MTLQDFYVFLMIVGFISITTLAIKWLIVDVKKYFKGESYKPFKFPKGRMWSIIGGLFNVSVMVFLLRQAIVYDEWYWWLAVIIYSVLSESYKEQPKEIKKENG